MKRFILTVLAIIIFACSHQTPPQNQQVQHETPKVLQGQSSDITSSFKRSGYGVDLFEELYGELSEKDPDLRSINERLEQHLQTLEDSLRVFDEYKDKSEDYYREAKNKLGHITDSSLKIALRQMIVASEGIFSNRISALEKLIQAISEKNISLKDRHMALKMVTTLKSIEKFQKDMMPGNRQLKNVIKEQDKLIAEMQTKAK